MAKKKLEKKTVAVIGLGYVGLPLAILTAKKGYAVYGFDLDKKKIEKIGLAVDQASGQVLVEWKKIPWDESDRPYWAALSSIRGIGPQLLATLVVCFGSAKAVFSQTDLALRSIKLPDKLILLIQRFKKENNILEWFASQKLSFLAAPEKDFPQDLRRQSSSPSHLWVWGDIKILNSRLPLAVVGTRKITPYGRDVTYELSAKLAVRGVTIVSGLMYGVDEVAMRAAMEAGDVLDAIDKWLAKYPEGESG